MQKRPRDAIWSKLEKLLLETIMNRKRALAIGLLVSLLSSSQAGFVGAQSADQGERYLIGSGVPGSAAYNVGVGLSSLAQIVLLPEENVSMTPVATDSYDQSLQQVIDGTSQFAVVDSVAAYRAAAEAGDRLQAVATLWHEVDHFIIADQYVQSGTISDLAILPSKDLALDLGNPDAVRDLLKGFGVRIEEGVRPARSSDWDVHRDMFDRGDIAGLAITSSVPSPAVQDMLRQLGGRAQLLEFSHWQLTRVGEGWHVHPLTPSDYPELMTQVDTVARTLMLVAHDEVPDQAVYQIVGMMFDNVPYLTNLEETAAQISLDHALDEIHLPLHPGAARYFREKGVSEGGPDGSDVARLDAAAGHAEHAGHSENAAHSGHAQGVGGSDIPEHIHDEAMLSRARAEVHNGEVVLKIGRPQVLSRPGTEIFAVYFGLGKTVPDEEGKAEVRDVAEQILAAYEVHGAELEVYVEGHTDSVGSWDTNYEIAHRRTLSVRDQLIAEGVPKSWIHIADYSEQGLAVPTADNVPEERNRRVEITLIPPLPK